MNLNLYDENLKRISIIGNNFVSCFWAEGYNTTEDFTLEVQATKEYKSKLKPDCYVGRDDRETLMVIKSIETVGTKIIAIGKQATRVLDDVAFIGTLPEGSVIDTSVKSAYNGSSKFHNLEFASTNLGVKYEQQISHKSFLELCTTMCQSADVGLKVIRKNGGLVAKFYKPEPNNNIKLSESFGNVKLNNIILSTENYRNYAIVLGEGEEDNRKRVDVDLTNGEKRREIIVDARDIQQEEGETATQYKKRLYARGVEALLEQQKTWECGILPLAKEFGSKYDLGDIVDVVLNTYGLKMQARISRFTQKQQMNQLETVVEVGNITIR
jgi:hypothetical protein